ncbi:hypothetical protein B296_00020136 [Ensete ventricosum]|uniref:Uncharacterized protein n=1 Tax=Ensete ventricosum TaxID=4639 RepID=A0A427AJB3_ENSVE|nr:hypothetical protein B296_00020136 [Ensete ventricosum]
MYRVHLDMVWYTGTERYTQVHRTVHPSAPHGTSPTTRWRRPCMRVTVYLSIDLGGHSGVEAGGRKGRGSDDKICRSRRKGCRCKTTDSRAMVLVAPWYRIGGTSVESSIPYSHGGGALVIKRAEEVENAKANSKYQDKAEGQRPRYFIRPVSIGFSSR